MHEGVLSVAIIEVMGIKNADNGSGGSDPYVRLGFGGQEYVTGVKMDVDFGSKLDDHSLRGLTE
eukprot:SAG31_NODE_19768_length_592_cov_0.821501_1_plen_64_part_00